MAKAQEKEIDLSRYIKKLQENILDFKLCRYGVREVCIIAANEFGISPKRSAERIMKILVRMGYLNVYGDGFKVTDRCYDEIEPVKPDLKREWDYFLKNVWGRTNGFLQATYVSALNDGEKKYLIENKQDYGFSVAYLGDFERGYGEAELVPVELGTTAHAETVDRLSKYRNGYRDIDLMVNNQELLDHIKMSTYEKRIDELLTANLPWGLTKLGLLPETAESLVRVRETDPLFGGSSPTEVAYSKDRKEWAGTLPCDIRSAELLIERLTAKLAGMKALQEKIEAFGGFEKFMEEYEKALRVQVPE